MLPRVSCTQGDDHPTLPRVSSTQGDDHPTLPRVSCKQGDDHPTLPRVSCNQEVNNLDMHKMFISTDYFFILNEKQVMGSMKQSDINIFRF